MDTAIRPTSRTTQQLAPTASQWLQLTINGAALIGLLLLLFTLQPSTQVLRVGDVADSTIVAQRKATYIDQQATAAKRQEVMASVTAVHKSNLAQVQLRRQQAASFLTHAIGIIESATPTTEKLAALRGLLPAGVSPAPLQQFANLRSQDLQVVKARSLALLSQADTWPFDSSQITPMEIGLLGSLPPQTTPLQRTAVGEVLAMFLTATQVTDFQATVRKQHAAADHVAPVTNTMYPGEVVVRRGDLVTSEVMEKLDALGVQTHHTGWRDAAASFIFIVVIVGMLFWYLHTFHTFLVTNVRLLLLIDAAILISVTGARLLASGHVLLPYFYPVAAISTFAAVVLAPEACIALTIAMSILAGWIVANSFELSVYYLVTGTVGALAIHHVRRVKQFILAGTYVTLFAMCTMVAFGLLDHTSDLTALQEYVIAAAFNGFMSSTLALGGFVLLSDFFGVTTMLRLLELVQPDQRLLRRLMVQAPGTYNHSLILASMVEHAAEEVDANSLAAKVGALYHDVGKLTNPSAFVENQLGIANIHDELEPRESAQIIRGHVPQGLRLARQHRLPRVILNAIGEHHGTMAISYFLHRARQQSEDVDVSLYTYPGPKPQSKETALLMLADGCEAAVRSAGDRSYTRIRDTVAHIFQERIEQGQLDECPLTLQDLHLAREAFCSVLNGLYHPRIEYPETADVTVEPRKVLAVVHGKRLRERA